MTTTTIAEQFENPQDFESLLEDAEQNAGTDREIHFVTDIQERYAKYGSTMYLSNSQKEHLERIAHV